MLLQQKMSFLHLLLLLSGCQGHQGPLRRVRTHDTLNGTLYTSCTSALYTLCTLHFNLHFDILNTLEFDFAYHAKTRRIIRDTLKIDDTLCTFNARVTHDENRRK